MSESYNFKTKGLYDVNMNDQKNENICEILRVRWTLLLDFTGHKNKI